MNTRGVAGLCALLAGGWLTGCGYPGEPLPPALNRPMSVRDLTVVERGDRIAVRFTVPQKTTEDLTVKALPDLELRIGPLSAGKFELAAWEKNSERIPVSDIHIVGTVASAEIPARALFGKVMVLGVRAHGPGGRDVGWSNLETITIVPTLPVPEAVELSDAPDAIRLDWHAAAPEYRIFRKGPGDTDWVLAGNSTRPFFLDSAIEFGTTYRYFVQSVQKTDDKYAESEPSAEISFKPVDRFAPAVPAGLNAIPGTRTIELVWERNAEKDFASYRIYRDGQKVADGQTAPSYSDHDVKPATRYRYQVSAVDTAGNESVLSGAVETAIP